MDNTKGSFKPITTLVIVGVHAMAIYAVWQMFSTGFSLWAWGSLVLMWFITMMGVTIGYHRCMTHQAFESSSAFRKVILVFAAMAFQGSGTWWCEVHNQHHVYADQKGDPHSPEEFGGGLKGFLWSHVGWMLFEVESPSKYVGPIRFKEDADLAWQRRYYLLLALLGFAIPYLMAGWNGVLLGGFFRLALCWNVAWGTNSFCHIFGSHALDHEAEVIQSREARNFPLHCFFWLLATLSCGEFWHANHHARQRSAYIGWRPSEFDPGGLVLKAAKKVDLVWDVRTPDID